MGWYGEHFEKCPNCNRSNAVEVYRNSQLESYYLACPDCGLCLFAPARRWVVQNSYIDKTIIGVDHAKLAPEEFIDEGKNEDIIKEGTAL